MGWLLYLVYDRGDRIQQLVNENTRLQIILQEKKTTTEEVVKRPDGTVTVKRHTVENKTKVLEKVAEKRVETKATVKQEKESEYVDSNYSLGITYSSRNLGGVGSLKDYLSLPAIEAGYRLRGALWLTIGHDLSDKSLSLGLRVEF